MMAIESRMKILMTLKGEKHQIELNLDRNLEVL